MSGSSGSGGARQGAVLTAVFALVLAAGAVSDAWGGAAPRPGAASRRVASADRPPADGASREPSAPAPSAPGPSARGDRWTAAYSPSEFADYSARLEGRYVGVGLRVRTVGRGVEIAGVSRGGPADRGGVRPGQRLAAVDGRHTAGRPVTEVVAQLRGRRSGSRVALTLDGGAAAPRTVTLRRSVLSTGDVSVRRLAAPAGTVPHGGAGTVTDIRVAEFSRGTGARIARAVADASRPGSGPPSAGVLLDLRGSGGGLLTEARRAAGVFLDGGPVARITPTGPGGRRARTLTATGGHASAVPLVVLVDRGTMSAAELLAGALRDRGRAVLVGDRTFGKGSVQRPTALPDGTVVERTVAHYRTPDGTRVEGTGLRPDVAVPAGAEPAAAQRQALTVLSGVGRP